MRKYATADEEALRLAAIQGWYADGCRRGILLLVTEQGRLFDFEYSSKVPGHEVIEVVGGSRQHRHYSTSGLMR